MNRISSDERKDLFSLPTIIQKSILDYMKDDKEISYSSAKKSLTQTEFFKHRLPNPNKKNPPRLSFNKTLQPQQQPQQQEHPVLNESASQAVARENKEMKETQRDIQKMQEMQREMQKEMHKQEQRKAAETNDLSSLFMGEGRNKFKVIKINFPKDTKYNTTQKRLRFVRKFGNPIERQHKTIKFYKYVLAKSNKKNKIVKKKIDGIWLHIAL